MNKEVGSLDAEVEQVPPSGRLVMRNARLDEMTVAIELMLHLQVDPALPGKMDLVIGEKITVRHLGTGQQGNQLVHKGSQPGVRLDRQDPGGSIQPFVGI
jgi:hypothetical protein